MKHYHAISKQCEGGPMQNATTIMRIMATSKTNSQTKTLLNFAIKLQMELELESVSEAVCKSCN